MAMEPLLESSLYNLAEEDPEVYSSSQDMPGGRSSQEGVA